MQCIPENSCVGIDAVRKSRCDADRFSSSSSERLVRVNAVKSIFPNLLLATLLLGCGSAAAATAYPAADFQPVTVFKDSDYIAKHSPPAPQAAPTVQPKQSQPPAAPALSAEPATSKQEPPPLASSEPTKDQTAASEAAGEQADEISLASYQAGLILFVLAGLVFWSVRLES
jgi:hypothetical protein